LRRRKWKELFRWCDEEEIDLSWEKIESIQQHQLSQQYYAKTVHQNPPKTLHVPQLSSPVLQRRSVATKESSGFAVCDDIATELDSYSYADPLLSPISNPFPFCNTLNLSLNRNWKWIHQVNRFLIIKNISNFIVLKIQLQWRTNDGIEKNREEGRRKKEETNLDRWTESVWRWAKWRTRRDYLCFVRQKTVCATGRDWEELGILFFFKTNQIKFWSR